MEISKPLTAMLQQKFIGRQGITRIIDSLALLMPDKLARMVGGVMVGVFVARYLRPKKFFLFGSLVALVTKAIAISFLRDADNLVRYLVVVTRAGVVEKSAVVIRYCGRVCRVMPRFLQNGLNLLISAWPA